MLCTNKTVAKFLMKNKIPTLYRVHTGPKTESLDDLRDFLKELGLSLGYKKSTPLPKHYAQLLRSVEGRIDENLVHHVLLRSMSRAFYSPKNRGHFSLGCRAYTHFTSPIRRYPDLLVHRSVKSVLNDPQERWPKKDDFIEQGTHCSTTERRADHATRDALNWLKCEYMLTKIGKTFNGVISMVTNFGLFVQIEEILIEGLVHIKNLPQDSYQFNITKQCLKGKHHIFHLGDGVKIKVIHVKMDDRRINFMLVNKKDSLNKKHKKGKK